MTNKINAFLFLFDAEFEISVSNTLFMYLSKEERTGDQSNPKNWFGKEEIQDKITIMEINELEKVRIKDFKINNKKRIHFKYEKD